MNKKMNIPAISQTLQEFQRQNAILEQKDELVDDAMDDAFDEDGVSPFLFFRVLA